MLGESYRKVLKVIFQREKRPPKQGSGSEQLFASNEKNEENDHSKPLSQSSVTIIFSFIRVFSE